jgi:hypothetical protein
MLPTFVTSSSVSEWMARSVTVMASEDDGRVNVILYSSCPSVYMDKWTKGQ